VKFFTIPTTLRNPLALAFPSLLDTSQEYSPESVLVTLLILKFPLERMRCLPDPFTCIAPDSQRMAGFGSPVGLHVSSTVVWMSAFMLDCGGLLPGPKPAGISGSKKEDAGNHSCSPVSPKFQLNYYFISQLNGEQS